MSVLRRTPNENGDYEVFFGQDLVGMIRRKDLYRFEGRVCIRNDGPCQALVPGSELTSDFDGIHQAQNFLVDAFRSGK